WPRRYTRTPRPSRTIASRARSSWSPHSQRSAWKMSPVTHSEWTRTRTSSRIRVSPRTRARCSLPSSGSRKATVRKVPWRVARSALAMSSAAMPWSGILSPRRRPAGVPLRRCGPPASRGRRTRVPRHAPARVAGPRAAAEGWRAMSESSSLLPLATTVDERERGADVALLPIGSFEQHGPFLPLATDTVIAQTIAGALAAAYPLLHLPPITISCSHEHEAWPGTVSISASTLYAIIHDISDSLQRSGITRLILVNGHGGNYVLGNVVQESAGRG